MRITVSLFLLLVLIAVGGHDYGSAKQKRLVPKPMVYDPQAKKWVPLVLPEGTEVHLFCVQTACAVADKDFENNRMLLVPVIDPSKSKEKGESESGSDGMFKTQAITF